ncbi:acetoacetate decarboxylase family protein [Nocardioides aurantiacus]|uniref:Acetoacetate decarboxylase n=1 Tax=Nocardioides aurantiacus TaxID=86796 RepID=A0A3N2CQM4_9ACTN|nr:acetoacetate decarboxylase family protein [Nocardioides aurantiacus]ROR89832.1 acetoacetate decarboxylase [Nocardioides aurantiacus]
MTGPATYPPSPWTLHGQLWLSLFRVRRGADPQHPDRPAGLYGVALVSYEDPSPLVYRELLCARPLGADVGITDIWVDSPASRAGGRDLWAIPKELASFRRTTRGRAERHATWEIGDEAATWASIEVTDAGPRTPRVPFAFRTRQVRDDGSVVVTPVRGTARLGRSTARWTAYDEGPLAWLAGERPLVTLRATDFAMEFGRAGG